MKEVQTKRPVGYQYFNTLREYLGGDLSKVFNGQSVYPRQLELHLPGDHITACNFNCFYCQGKLVGQDLGPYEEKALKLLDELQGRIPFIIYGGAYTEPLLNPYLLDCLDATKQHNSTFGIHTNGSLLEKLEKEKGFVSRLCKLATSQEDYLSVSLDAGTPYSHMRSKNLDKNYFDEIIRGITRAVELRGRSDTPSIRVCYLLNKFNSSQEELEGIICLMKEIGVDSLRFSIPYDNYGRDFSKVRQYKEKVEIPQNRVFQERLKPLVSTSSDDKPFIFYLSPEHQDVDKMTFSKCIYSYYQITFGADGYVYKCSSIASPSFKNNRLGLVPDNLEEFEAMILENQDPDFDPHICFEAGGRCNRMALEINLEWEMLNEKSECCLDWTRVLGIQSKEVC